jgi:hypothetical protein
VNDSANELDEPSQPSAPQAEAGDARSCAHRHLRFGWWSLLCFATLGIVLETLHGFKVGWYLSASNETRRLMWTLAHAHGVLLALVHVAFGLCAYVLPDSARRLRRAASPCLVAASILLPGGFFLGGLYLYSGDPGLGIFLVPAGAALLLVAVLLAALGYGARVGSRIG